MEEIMACRDCTVGFTQALESSIVWSCPEHGLKALSISDTVSLLMSAKKRAEELEKKLVELAEASLRYDSAIQWAAGSSAVQDKWANEGYSNPLFVEGEDLDALYITWLEKALKVVEERAERSGNENNGGA